MLFSLGPIWDQKHLEVKIQQDMDEEKREPGSLRRRSCFLTVLFVFICVLLWIIPNVFLSGWIVSLLP